MQFGIFGLRALFGRPVLIFLAAAVAAIAVAACRGGGAAPSGSPVIPVIIPTIGQSECATSIYPAEAPPFISQADMDLTTTASGLGYVDVEAGGGEQPAASSPVVVRYTGWLSDGCVFDSSFLRNPNTSTFGLSFVIPGWSEGIAGMREGGERRLVIPADLGYGDLGSAPRIPPKATLIFYVELVDILQPAEATATVETRITATVQAQETARANAEATATAFAGGVPATATPTLAPTP